MDGVLVQILVLASVFATILSCPVKAPCECRNETNPYTRKLEYIADCSGKGLRVVPSFVGGEKVDRLLLNSNNIIKLSNLSFANILPAVIDLSSNGLQIIAPGAFLGLEDRLVDLELSTNRLILPLPGVNVLKSLKTLNLDYNPNMNTIYTGSFYALGVLDKLVLSRSYISTIQTGAFDGLKMLTSLDFYGNQLTKVPTSLSGLTNLRYLNFDGNSITKVEANAFRGLSNINELQLSRNQFSGADQIDKDAFNGLDSLHTLGFYYDLLGKVPSQAFHSLKNLKTLDLSYNKITHVTSGAFANLTSLTQLDVSGNGLVFEPGMFKGLENTLNYILIRRNGLTSIPVDVFREVPSLRWIDAASSSFPKDLPSNFAAGLPINRLSLMWMNLTSVKPDTFAGLAQPFHLDINSNSLRSLDFITNFCQYEYIAADENPVNCDCHVYNVTMAATTHITGKCASPKSYEGLDIGGQKFNELAAVDCKNQHITGPVKCPWQ